MKKTIRSLQEEQTRYMLLAVLEKEPALQRGYLSKAHDMALAVDALRKQETAQTNIRAFKALVRRGGTSYTPSNAESRTDGF